MAAIIHNRKLMLNDETSNNTPLPIEQLCARPCRYPSSTNICPAECFDLCPLICNDDVNNSVNSPDPFASSAVIIAFLPAIMTTVLLCGCFSIYRWISRRSQPPPQELYGGVDLRRWYVGTTGGLRSSVINAIAIRRYKKGEGGVEGSECAVCLSEFEEDEILRMLPNCKHGFHVPCIDTWLKSHTNCPVCRAGVESTENSDVSLSAVLVLNGEHGGTPVNNGGEREDSQAHECSRSDVSEKEDESTEQYVVPKNNHVEHS